MTLTPKVSVILPCRNEAEHIERCLLSILDQEQPEGGFEVLIADGMSEDGTREVIRKAVGKAEGGNLKPESGQGSEASGQWSVVGGQSPVAWGPQVRVIDNPGRIVSTGLNAAIRAARGDIIIRMDAHTEYAPDYIRRCVETLQRTGAENVGGPARTRAETFLERAVAAAYHTPFSVGGACFHDTGHEGWVDTVTYGCWRRETFERFGQFDEELVRNQDDEHNLRIVRGGGKVWQSPEIKSWYHPRGSLRGLFLQYMQYGYWKVRVIQKHKLPASWRHLVPGAFVLVFLALYMLSALRHLFTGHQSPVFESLGPWVPALLFLLLATYFACVGFASLVTAARSEWKLLPVLPIVFYCYHFGYGWGFVRGVWDFVVLRRGAGAALSEITRVPATTD